MMALRVSTPASKPPSPSLRFPYLLRSDRREIDLDLG